MKSYHETYPDTFPEMKDVVLLSDQDLLKSLLRKSVKLPNNSLAMAFGMVGSVDEVQDVMDGPSRYMLLCARELMSRALYEQAIARPLLDSPSAAREFLRLKLAGMAYETFWVLYLDAQNRVLAAEEMFRGTLTQTSVYPREIARQALRRNAASLVLAHNHPSGDSRPSKSDEHLTQNIKASMALLDVRVLDHFVVTDTQCVSMAEMGLV